MRFFRQIVVILILITAYHGMSQSTELKIEPYQFKNNNGMVVDAEIGKFVVLENRSVANSRKIELSFVRFKSTNPNPGSPIIYLAGGPGGSGINTAKRARFDLFMALREIGDVIAFDQRGTGLSNQIPRCTEVGRFPLDEFGTSEEYISKMAEAAKKCISFWEEEGVDLQGYNTVENANDIEDLRKLLNAPKINLWGISYGSHLAFEYIKRYEEHVEKVILAGLEGPDHTVKLPNYNQEYLEYLSSRVQKDPLAAAIYPDLLGLMKEVLDALEKEPIKTQVTDPRSGQTYVVGISKLDMQLVTSYFLTKNPENSAKLPYMYLQMKKGNYAEVGQMVAGIKQYAGRVEAMSLFMDAASGISPKRWRKVQKQAKKALLGRTTNFPYPDIAIELGLPALDDSFRENPVSSLPILLFSGTLDGRTYIQSAKELSSGFKNSKHIIIDGAGHDLFMSTPKVGELMLKFLGGEMINGEKIIIDVPSFMIPN